MFLYKRKLLTSDDHLRGYLHCHACLKTLVRAGRRFRIGITGTPERRVQFYANTPGSRYSSMDVLWETEQEDDARAVENTLVDMFREHCDNAGPGGGNLEGPPYFLYVVH